MAPKATVKGLMDTNLVSVAPYAKASTAMKLLENSNLQIVPVMEGERLVGIIDADSLKEKGKESESVRKLMQRPLFVEETSGIDYAIKYIMEHGISRVPVVESSIGMRCTGIVTASALLKAKKNPMQ